MSALSIQPTYPIFTESDGLPLEAGYIWIGAANLDPQGNPINVYWDAALTILAPQPIRTLAGYPSRNGSPGRLYVNSDYSIRVMNKNGSSVYSTPSATERISSNLVSYHPPFAGGVATTVQDKLAQTVSVKDFGFGATGDGVTDDTDAIRDAIYYGGANGKAVFFPAGNYRVTSSIELRCSIYGDATYYGDVTTITADNAVAFSVFVNDTTQVNLRLRGNIEGINFNSTQSKIHTAIDGDIYRQRISRCRIQFFAVGASLEGVYVWLDEVSFNYNGIGTFIKPLLANSINLASTMFHFKNCVWQYNDTGIDQYYDPAAPGGTGAEINTLKAVTFTNCGWENSTTYGVRVRGWFKFANFIGCWTEANATAGLSGDFTGAAFNCNFTDTNSATNTLFRGLADISNDISVTTLKFKTQTAYTGQTKSTLNIYSEGAWTTTVTESNCSGVTLSDALYTRVGRLVTLSGRFSGALTTTATQVGITFTPPFNQSASASRAVGSAYHTCSSTGDGFSGVRDATGGNPLTAFFQAPANQVTKADGSAFTVDFTYTYEAA
jgi:hypothetical protein